MHKYYPILLSKSGEIKALKHLERHVKKEVAPVIQLLDLQTPLVTDPLYKFLINDWKFPSNKILIDVSLFPNLEGRTNEIKDFLQSIIRAGVNAVPCIQINSPSTYLNMVKSLVERQGCSVCIKTSNRSGGFNNFSQSTYNTMGMVGAIPENTILLLDMGYVTEHDYLVIGSVASFSINSLQAVEGWSDIIVAAGSFPINLNDYSVRATPHDLPRYEWKLWENLMTTTLSGMIKYGDFGTKHPIYQNLDGFAGSISVKYTRPHKFIVYRGEKSKNHRNGHRQYVTHAAKLISGDEYSGIEFSWGDLEINQKATQNIESENCKPGNASTWVQFSQNHHITLVHGLI